MRWVRWLICAESYLLLGYHFAVPFQWEKIWIVGDIGLRSIHIACGFRSIHTACGVLSIIKCLGPWKIWIEGYERNAESFEIHNKLWVPLGEWERQISGGGDDERCFNVHVVWMKFFLQLFHICLRNWKRRGALSIQILSLCQGLNHYTIGFLKYQSGWKVV